MDVSAVAKLANLPVTVKEQKPLIRELSQTLETIRLINELDTTSVAPTSQVTGLTNVFREDRIDTARILSPPKGGFYYAPLISHH